MHRIRQPSFLFLLAGAIFVSACAGKTSGGGEASERVLDASGRLEGTSVGGLPLEGVERRCSDGGALACTVLGLHYIEREGTDPSGPAADPLLQGCRGGEPVACGKYASMLVTADEAERDLQRAFRLYRKGCRLGGAFACTGLARMYGNGVVVEKSLEESRRLHRHACRSGDPRACYWYGEFEHDQGRRPTAMTAYISGCAGGHDDACSMLRANFGLSLETQEGRAEVVERLDEACESDELFACVVLGVHREHGRTANRDLGRAADLYRRGCKDGGGDETVWPRACSRLGALYENGRGVDRDLAEARRYYRQSCDVGYAVGCSYLGSMYRRGVGGDEDEARAVELFRRSCSQGHARSCYWMGRATESGDVVDRNLLEAAIFYRVGCTSGSAGACNSLGVLFDEGKGVEADPQRAAEYYDRACGLGEPKGCFNLGVARQIGNGIERDAAEAADLFRRACREGVQRACDRLEAGGEASEAP